MKILSYNVNGIRAAMKKGLLDWFVKQDADIICIQETKAQPDQVDPAVFSDLGYHAYWHSAEKKGYSGVLTLSKKEASFVHEGINLEKYDIEGRVIRTDIDGWTVFNCYFPSGSAGEHRHEYKLEFLEDFGNFMEEQKKDNDKIIVLGDYNIVNTELDIHNPKRKDKPSGYRPEEREWLTDWFENGFTDAFRFLHPETIEFSWWSYRAGSRGKDKGWRIDYISVSSEQKDNIVETQHHKNAQHSDHCGLHMVVKD